MSILTLTFNPALDVSAAVDHVSPNRKLRCDQPRYEPGGGGINVTAALKELRCDSRAMYLCGGPPGQTLGKVLDHRGIDHIPIDIEGWTRSNFAVRDTSAGDQYRFVMPGPEVTDAEMDHFFEELRNLVPVPEYIVASGSLPPGIPAEIMKTLAATVRDMGARLIADTSGNPLRMAAEQGVFLLKPNMNELRDLTGADVSTEDAQEKALNELIDRGACEVAVLSLGAAGVLLTTSDTQKRLRAPSVPIASRVGAGDSMVAGILAGFRRGYDIRNAVLLGVAAGSAAVMTKGTALCRCQDAERLYENLTAG